MHQDTGTRMYLNTTVVIDPEHCLIKEFLYALEINF